jgi:hypothetical protein
LTVAVTRANRNIFGIGDPKVGSTLPGFNSVAYTLKQLQPNDILMIEAHEKIN